MSAFTIAPSEIIVLVTVPVSLVVTTPAGKSVVRASVPVVVGKVRVAAPFIMDEIVGVVSVLFVYAALVSTVFEVKYPNALVEMYPYPWWRALLVILVVAGWHWSPLIGVLLAVVVFFYIHDMFILMDKQINNSSLL